MVLASSIASILKTNFPIHENSFISLTQISHFLLICWKPFTNHQFYPGNFFGRQELARLAGASRGRQGYHSNQKGPAGAGEGRQRPVVMLPALPASAGPCRPKKFPGLYAVKSYIKASNVHLSIILHMHLETTYIKTPIDRIRAIIRISPLITDTQTNTSDW